MAEQSQLANGHGDLQFSWGRKLGVQYYESFSYNGVEYSLNDCVYVRCGDEDEPSVGKLVKIFETSTGVKRVKIVWFFRPEEIEHWLGNCKPLSNELFLASGKGKGLSNSNPLESICGKCSVICISKDRRNPRPTEEELKKADFLFFRTFDVENCTISKIFPDIIAEVEVKNYFNQRKDTKPPHPAKGVATAKTEQPGSSSPTVALEKKPYPFVKSSATGVPDISTVKKIKFESASDDPQTSQLKSAKLKIASGVPHASIPKNIKPENASSVPETYPPKRKRESVLDAPDISLQKKRKLESASGTPHDSPRKNVKLESSSGVPNTSSMKNIKLKNGSSVPETYPLKRKPESAPNAPDISLLEKKREKYSGPPPQSKASQEKDSDGRGQKLNLKINQFRATADHLGKNNGMRCNSQMMEVERRPNADSNGWFTEQPWEKRMIVAEEKGSLVLLENLDPSFTSADVEDIIWHAFNIKASARMIQQCTFSSPHSGKAFAIFKSKDVADFIIYNLKARCLMLDDGRPLIAQVGVLKNPSNGNAFVGHLKVGRKRLMLQREEVKNAVSTSHYSQSNTIEYEMALEWLILHDISNGQWTTLYEEHAKEIAELKSKVKTPL